VTQAAYLCAAERTPDNTHHASYLINQADIHGEETAPTRSDRERAAADPGHLRQGHKGSPYGLPGEADERIYRGIPQALRIEIRSAGRPSSESHKKAERGARNHPHHHQEETSMATKNDKPTTCRVKPGKLTAEQIESMTNAQQLSGSPGLLDQAKRLQTAVEARKGELAVLGTRLFVRKDEPASRCTPTERSTTERDQNEIVSIQKKWMVRRPSDQAQPVANLQIFSPASVIVEARNSTTRISNGTPRPEP